MTWWTLETLTMDLDAGVVDQHVQAAEAVDRRLDHRDDVLLLGHVALHEDVADAHLGNLGGAGMHSLLGVGGLVGLAQVVDCDVGAELGEADGDRLADARAAAGDEDVLALQPGHGLGRGDGGSGGRHGCVLLGGRWLPPLVRRGAGPLHRAQRNVFHNPGVSAREAAVERARAQALVS